MPYEKSLDVELFKDIKEFEGTRISIGVFSYNNGEKKLQLSRENNASNGEWRFAKLGRLNKEEAQQVIPAMMKAVEQM